MNRQEEKLGGEVGDHLPVAGSMTMTSTNATHATSTKKSTNIDDSTLILMCSGTLE
jgi:hypothetical protein